VENENTNVVLIRVEAPSSKSVEDIRNNYEEQGNNDNGKVTNMMGDEQGNEALGDGDEHFKEAIGNGNE